MSLDAGPLEILKGFKNGNVDEFRVFGRELTKVEVKNLYDGSEIKPNKNLFVSSYDEESKKIRLSLQKTRSDLAAFEDGLQEIMVMSELRDPKPSYVLNRGSYVFRKLELGYLAHLVMN